MIGIYKITSPSGKIYIGQSWNIEKRFKSYKYKNKQSFLMRSFDKYGLENHNFEILEELSKGTTQEILDLKEIYYMKSYKDNGFILLNIREGGSRGKLAPETILKIKNSLKGRISNNKGKKMSDKSKQKISNANKGRQKTPEEIIKRLLTKNKRSFTEKELIQLNNFRILGTKSIIRNIIQLISQDESLQTKHYSRSLRYGEPIEEIVSDISLTANVTSFHKIVERTLKHYIKDGITEDSCPNCGSKLFYESGVKFVKMKK